VASLVRLGRTYRHMGRAREVAAVLVKSGFEDFLLRLGVNKFLEQVCVLVSLK
jgi:hypothetical protein